MAGERNRRDSLGIAAAALEAAEKVLMKLEVRGPLAGQAVQQALATVPTRGPAQFAEALRLLTAHTKCGPIVAAEKATQAATLRADALARDHSESALSRARVVLAGLIADHDVNTEQAANAWLEALENYSPAAQAITAATGRASAAASAQSAAHERNPGVDGLLRPGTSD